jgi:DNA (cytosine-5)-methyltransferase 1
MGVVIGALAERGYSIAWRVLDAQYFGVPQRRRRVFIVGCLGDEWRTPAEVLDLAEGSAGDTPPSRAKRQNSAGTATDGSRSGSLLGSDIVDTLTVADLTKGQGSHQAVQSNLLQVVEVGAHGTDMGSQD